MICRRLLFLTALLLLTRRFKASEVKLKLKLARRMAVKLKQLSVVQFSPARINQPGLKSPLVPRANLHKRALTAPVVPASPQREVTRISRSRQLVNPVLVVSSMGIESSLTIGITWSQSANTVRIKRSLR